MLFVLLFWVAVFLIVMRVLTWVAKTHPGARNFAAFVVEVGAALAIAVSASAVAGVAAGAQASMALVVSVALFAVIGAVAHYFASQTARSSLVVFLPFASVGVAVLFGVFNPPWRSVMGIGLVALGGVLGWLKFRDRAGPTVARSGDESAQA